jgi:hypothetical protein
VARRSRRSESFLSESEVQALRNVVVALRQRQGRASIILRADVDARDFDNFITKRADDAKAKFRTEVPNNTFQRRLIDYIFQSADVTNQLEELSQKDAGLRRDIDILRVKRGRHAVLGDDDYYFKHLAGIDATDENRCKAICDELAGDYELYRLSSRVGMIHKSHMTIFRFNPYHKVPGFINRLVHANHGRRTVIGNIYELGSNYFFSGFIMRDENSTRMQGGYLGSKVMILKKIRNDNDVLTLMGFFYTSGSHEIYDFGAMRAIRSGKKFDPMEVGEIQFDIDNIVGSTKELNLPFMLEDIALRFPEPALSKGRIFSALPFDMKYPRRRNSKLP